MRKIAIAGWMFIGFIGCLLNSSPCHGADKYPSKPITFLVAYVPGATVDITIRALAESAQRKLGQPIVVVNRTGGGGVLMMNDLYVSKPDGYTIGCLTTGNIINKHMLKVPYHPVNDFEPILQYAVYQCGLVVRSDSPFKNFNDLVVYARNNPNKIKYSTGGIGVPHHLVMLQLEDAAKVKWANVPFDGGQEAITAILGGHVDCSAQTSAFKPFVDAGRLRLLATFGEKPMKTYPNVPTLLDLGYNITAMAGYFIVGPMAIPKDRLKILHDFFYEAMQEARFKQALETFDMSLSYLNSENSKKKMMEIFETSGKLLAGIGKK